ncbi:hypothetical protein PthstB1num2_32860 [Parageobacillus thermoglucosidasius]|nr:hypothetical protein PthstB1num2_32860 [Parageobacillus thermoglucosidasius]
MAIHMVKDIKDGKLFWKGRLIGTETWIDANVIIRNQAPQKNWQKRREKCTKKQRPENRSCAFPPLRVAECCWVLSSFYEVNPKDISDALPKFTTASAWKRKKNRLSSKRSGITPKRAPASSAYSGACESESA